VLFPTGEFLLIYLPITLGLFFLIARFSGPPLAAAWLVLASVIFYGSWHTEHVAILVVSIFFNYCAGGWILSASESGRPSAARRRLLFAVSVDLLALAYFKYLNFILSTFTSLGFGGEAHVDVALPLGISFFTFTQIAYLVDVHAGRVVERSPVKYALFVTYFPHLVAGPVLHHAEMMPQFGSREIYRPALGNIWLGMAYLTIGMIKKALIADSFAPVANDVFERASNGAVGTVAAWAGVLSYTNQIYFDFSGYSDMAVGLALLIGVRLPYNFNSPYKATSIIDFWRRWHMTLSRFLRDYLYFALGGNRKGKTRRYLNLFATMVLGGLWHGAAWTFVIWGALHGAYLMINHGWRWFASLPEVACWISRPFLVSVGNLVGGALTLVCVVVAWTFFRAEGLGTATTVLRALAGHGVEGNGVGAVADPSVWIVAAALFLVICKCAPNSQELIEGMAKGSQTVLRHARSRPAQAIATGTMIVAVVLLAAISESRNVTEFIYFNF
jgi:D-alanyl-lipoteichoic acid acyltransferase DltB (MBOAT superfamily)